ncbi:unnamed protein product, partial [marine sediment metagenome]
MKQRFLMTAVILLCLCTSTVFSQKLTRASVEDSK